MAMEPHGRQATSDTRSSSGRLLSRRSSACLRPCVLLAVGVTGTPACCPYPPVTPAPQATAVLRRVVEIVNGQLCPACARRAIGVKSTGLCGPCHYDHLRLAHEEAIAEREAQRRLWAARSKLHRLRGKEPDEPDLEESLC